MSLRSHIYNKPPYGIDTAGQRAILRKRQAASDIGELASYDQLALGVLPLNINNFTMHQTRSFCDLDEDQNKTTA